MNLYPEKRRRRSHPSVKKVTKITSEQGGSGNGVTK